MVFVGQAVFIVIVIVDGNTVVFVQVVDVCQLVVVIILLLFCRFVVYRAVRDAVRRIVVLEDDKFFIFILREFFGQVIMITLRSFVKVVLLY